MTAVSTVAQPPRISRSEGLQKKQNMFWRILERIVEARQRQVNRELAEILGRQGGIMGQSETDPLQAERRTYPFEQMPALKGH